MNIMNDQIERCIFLPDEVDMQDGEGEVFFPDEEDIQDGEGEVFFPDEGDDDDVMFEDVENRNIFQDDRCNSNIISEVEIDDDCCCSERCLSKLSRQDVKNSKEGYPENGSSQARWILQYFQMFSTVYNYVFNGSIMKKIKTSFFICGKAVCDTCWRNIYGITKYKFTKYRQMFLNGESNIAHGNTDTFKMRRNSSECVGWLLNYVSSVGEHLPNENRIELPAGMTKRDIYKKMEDEQGKTAVPEKSFYRLWKTFCQNVKTTKGSTFSKCHFCITINDHLLTSMVAKQHSKAELLRVERQKHWNDIREERLAYYKRRDSSRQDPSEILCIILDAMDQCKTALPILRRRVSKEINSRVVPPIKTYLTGALIHRQDNSYNKVGHCYFDFTQYSHDTNLNISVLMEILKEYRNELGNQLHLQMDSASNNKNSVMIAFGGILVYLKIFKEVYFHMLPVGHTHEDIDAMFHNIADGLKVDVMTFPDLVSQIKKIGFIRNVQQVQTVWDIKNWLESHMLGCHSFNDCFHILFHYNSKGNLVWHYKKWSKDKWLPDPADQLTYVHERDKDGIVIFKSLPTGMPNVVPPSWNGDLIRQLDFVGNKLIQSGLLTSQEQAWWREVSVNTLQDEVDSICPLIELQRAVRDKEEEIPVLSPQITEMQKQQKRVNVAYSGKYLNPTERKARKDKEENTAKTMLMETDVVDQDSDFRFPVTTRSGRKATTYLTNK